MYGDAPRIVRMAEIEIHEQYLHDYRALLAEVIEASVSTEPGVLALQAVSMRDNPAHFRLLEVYASHIDYEAHLQTAHFLKYKTGTLHMVKSLKLVDVDPLRICAKSDFTSAK